MPRARVTMTVAARPLTLARDRAANLKSVMRFIPARRMRNGEIDTAHEPRLCRPIARGEPGQDGPPRRIGERREGRVEALRRHLFITFRLHNSAVIYMTARRPVKPQPTRPTPTYLAYQTCPVRVLRGGVLFRSPE